SRDWVKDARRRRAVDPSGQQVLAEKILECAAALVARQPSGVRPIGLDAALLQIVGRQNEVTLDRLRDERGARLTLGGVGAETAARCAQNARHGLLLSARLQRSPKFLGNLIRAGR